MGAIGPDRGNPVMSRRHQHDNHPPIDPAAQKADRGRRVTLAAPLLVAAEAVAQFFLALLLAAPGLALVFGAVKHADRAVQATPAAHLLRQFGVDFAQVMVQIWIGQIMLDCIKVFVCNVEAEMCRLLLKHYDWQKEVVPALVMIVERTGDVKLEAGRIEVTLRRFTDREIDYAARHLGEDLNRMQPATLDKFGLPIHYRVQ